MSSSCKRALFTKCSFQSDSLVFGVSGSAWICRQRNGRQKWTNKESWIPSSLLAPLQDKMILNWTNHRLGFNISLSNRPLVWCLNEFNIIRCMWPGSRRTWTCRRWTLKRNAQKSRRFVNYKLTKLIGSSSHLFTRQVKNMYSSHRACIRSSYCFVGQKSGSSIHSISEQRVTLCYFLKATFLVQEKKCYVLETFLPPCFFCACPSVTSVTSYFHSFPVLLNVSFFFTPIVTTYVGWFMWGWI